MPTVLRADIENWLRVARAEFDEMPGLALTVPQAARLWSLDSAACIDVLGRLRELGYLTTTRNGAFRRATAA
jgi:hypothetical protein